MSEPRKPRFSIDPRIKRLLAPVQAHWFMGIAALGVSSFLTSLDPLIGKAIIDEGIGKKNVPLLWHMLIMMAALIVLALILETVGQFLIDMCLEKIRIQLQSDVARTQVAGGKGSAATKLSAAQFNYIATGAVQDACVFLTSLPAKAVRSVVQLVWIGFIVTAFSPVVGLATLAAALLLTFLSRKISDRIANVASAFGQLLSGVGDRLTQIFSARGLIRQFHRAAESLESLRAAQEEARSGCTRMWLWETVYRGIENGWSLAFTIAVIAITGTAVISGKLSLGQYIAISVYVGRIQGPIRALLVNYKEALKGKRQFEWVMSTIEESDAVAAANDGKTFWAGAIKAEAVEHGALKGATFEIARGSRVLFAGEDPAA
ncbi:MAG: ABC transporter ATP-binding protein, partial [Deltaproteobacteria bacterium]|nr:ABC transporter ATP-binding protein [Deltaproteobacteria bacterium]